MPGKARPALRGRAAPAPRGRTLLWAGLGLGLLLTASAGVAFPFWLDSAQRSNRFDPHSPQFRAATPALSSTPSPGASATASPSPAGTPTSSPTPSTSPTASPSSTVTPTYTPTVVPGGAGATLAFDEYEAEDGTVNATVIGPSRTLGNMAAEASGRKAVRLNATGDSVSIQSLHDANAIVLRYCIPDAPAGGGITATVSVYVGGVFLQKLALTSRYSWFYGMGGANTWNIPYDDNPADGGPFHYYDEARSLTADIPAGSTVTIQKDADDLAAFYVIDLVDLEKVGPPLAEPSGFLAITDFGATGVPGHDDGPAIQACITTAAATSQGVWIPQGTFYSTAKGITVTGVTIRGAGMWYSTVSGLYARFNLVANQCRFYDFAILGDTVNRDDSSPDNGFNNDAGAGSRLENIWIEHTKCGFWVGCCGDWPSDGPTTDGLVVTGCRIRDTLADGVNINNGAKNVVIQNNHLRYTGDDSLASWSNGGAGKPNLNNSFLNNTIQLPWRANCVAVYGGSGTMVRDNLVSDTYNYPGIFVAQQFSSTLFAGATTVQANTVLRCGGLFWGTNFGAVCVAPTEGDISGLVLKDLSVTASTYYGLQIQGAGKVNAAQIGNVADAGSGLYGIQAQGGAKGSATVDGLVVQGSGGLAPGALAAFTFVRGSGNIGW